MALLFFAFCWNLDFSFAAAGISELRHDRLIGEKVKSEKQPSVGLSCVSFTSTNEQG